MFARFSAPIIRLKLCGIPRSIWTAPLVSTTPPISSPPIVCSWNEWDPLEEVIVGLAGGSAVPPLRPAEESKIFHMPNTLGAAGPRDPAKIAAAAAELDGFAKILEAHGVKVRRPREEENKGFETPYFSTEHMNGWTCPRDVLTVRGYVTSPTVD